MYFLCVETHISMMKHVHIILGQLNTGDVKRIDVNLRNDTPLNLTFSFYCYYYNLLSLVDGMRQGKQACGGFTIILYFCSLPTFRF